MGRFITDLIQALVYVITGIFKLIAYLLKDFNEAVQDEIQESKKELEKEKLKLKKKEEELKSNKWRNKRLPTVTEPISNNEKEIAKSVSFNKDKETVKATQTHEEKKGMDINTVITISLFIIVAFLLLIGLSHK